MILELVTPRGILLHKEGLTEISAPTLQGEIGILPGHRPAILRMGGGSVKYAGESQGEIFVRGGFLEISEKGEIIMLADDALLPEKTDLLTLQINAGLSLKGFSSDEEVPVVADHIPDLPNDDPEARRQAEDAALAQTINSDFNQAIRDYLEHNKPTEL